MIYRLKFRDLGLVLALCMALSLALSAHAQSDDEEDDPTMLRIAPNQPIFLGVAGDLSNVLPGTGLDIAQAVRLAVDEANAEGGISGFPLELLIEDDLCTADGARIAAQTLIDGGAVAVVGHLCSGASIPASELYQTARVPMVSPASTAGLFTSRGLDVVNRTVFSDNVQGEVAARYIYQVLGVRRIVVLHNGTSYGEGLARTVVLRFHDQGGSMLLFEAIDPEQSDYSELLTRIRDDYTPELIYLGGYELESAAIVNQMYQLGMDEIIFFGGDGINTESFLVAIDPDIELNQVYSSFGASTGDTEANADFDRRYEETFGVAPDTLGANHAQAYDAAQIIIKALGEVAEVDEEGYLLIDREALILALRATQDHAGLSGTITCNDMGDCGQALINVFLAQDGQWIQQEVPPRLQVGYAPEN